jgi:hypothetical protein
MITMPDFKHFTSSHSSTILTSFAIVPEHECCFCIQVSEITDRVHISPVRLCSSRSSQLFANRQQHTTQNVRQPRWEKGQTDYQSTQSPHLQHGVAITCTCMHTFLGMFQWIAVNLAGAGQQEPCANSLCQPKHVQCSNHIGLVTQGQGGTTMR